MDICGYRVNCLLSGCMERQPFYLTMALSLSVSLSAPHTVYISVLTLSPLAKNFKQPHWLLVVGFNLQHAHISLVFMLRNPHREPLSGSMENSHIIDYKWDCKSLHHPSATEQRWLEVIYISCCNLSLGINAGPSPPSFLPAFTWLADREQKESLAASL